MNLFKTNKEYWEELLKKNALWSHTKDGEPKTIVQKIIGFAYPIIILILLLINIFAIIKMPKKTWRWRTYLTTLVFGSIIGWIWGIWMLKSDPNFPAWLYPPWASTGIEFLQGLEDWLFYPLCTSLFYIFFRLVKIKDTSWNRKNIHITIISTYMVLAIVSLCIFVLAGRTETIMFLLPGIILYIIFRDSINVKKFLYFQLFVIIFEMLWDWTAVSWIHFIPGMSWASEWIYITFDKAGNHYQSSVFLDYTTHRWNWIFNNPLEITPWFGICGGLLNYTMFVAADKIFYNKSDNP